MLRKVLNYFCSAVVSISAPELLAIGANIAAFILFGDYMQVTYLWVIVILCDIAILCSHGAWIKSESDTTIYGPWRAPTPVLIRCIACVMFVIMASQNDNNVVLNAYAWYLITVSAICWAFYCILLTLHHGDSSWLAGTNGRIGVPNWISIMRIALSILVPHLYAVQPFGENSATIATIILIVAIITDAADGYIARRFDQMTKAGKALDPLGDKIIFYPTAVAFILATTGQVFLADPNLRLVFYICLAIMIARDILFIVWFSLYYAKLSSGIGASIVDKIRMAAMCVWLGTAALALTISSIEGRMAIAGLICICIVAILSVISVFVDYRRIHALIKPPKVIEPRPDIYGDDDENL